MALFAVLATVVLVPAVAQYPPAPNSGGLPCTHDFECGIPAADCPTTRDNCVSLSGKCEGGKCVCLGEQFGCPNCGGRTHLVRNATDPSKFYYSTVLPMLDGSGKMVGASYFRAPCLMLAALGFTVRRD